MGVRGRDCPACAEMARLSGGLRRPSVGISRRLYLCGADGGRSGCLSEGARRDPAGRGLRMLPGRGVRGCWRWEKCRWGGRSSTAELRPVALHILCEGSCCCGMCWDSKLRRAAAECWRPLSRRSALRFRGTTRGRSTARWRRISGPAPVGRFGMCSGRATATVFVGNNVRAKAMVREIPRAALCRLSSRQRRGGGNLHASLNQKNPLGVRTLTRRPDTVFWPNFGNADCQI